MAERVAEGLTAEDAQTAAALSTPEPCDHEWVDARNEAVESGEVCIRCHAIRSGELS